MTDLYDEWWTQRRGIEEALKRGGEILVTGLGLGLVAEAILRTPESNVTRVTIVEQSADVIQLVGPFLKNRYGARMEIVEGNAFSWQNPTGRNFTVGWHDIWPDPFMPGIADEMRRLADRYSPWCDWQGFWPESYADALARK